MRLRQDDILVAEDADTKFGTLAETPLAPFIEDFYFEDRDLAFVNFQEQFEGNAIADLVTPELLPEAFWVNLSDPAQTEILQVRGQWNREITIERIEEVLDFCNDWNTDRIWPKAYFRVRDNGMIQVYAEVSVDLEHGATDEQLDRLLACGLSTSAMLFDTLDGLYPDPATVAP